MGIVIEIGPDISQRDQTLHCRQTNIAGDPQGPVLSGEFHDKVIIYQQSPKPCIPIQKPLRPPYFVGREKELDDLLTLTPQIRE